MVFHYLSKRRAAVGLESPLLGTTLGRALACPLPGTALGLALACPLPGHALGLGMKKYQKSSCSAYCLYSKNSYYGSILKCLKLSSSFSQNGRNKREGNSI